MEFNLAEQLLQDEERRESQHKEIAFPDIYTGVAADYTELISD